MNFFHICALLLTSVTIAMDIQSPLIADPDPETGHEHQKQLITYIKKVDRDGIDSLLNRLKNNDPDQYARLISSQEVLDTAREMVVHPPVHMKELMTHFGYLCISTVPLAAWIWCTVAEQKNSSRHPCYENLIRGNSNKDIATVCDALNRSDDFLTASACAGLGGMIYNFSRMAVSCCDRRYSRTIKDSRIIFEQLNRRNLASQIIQADDDVVI